MAGALHLIMQAAFCFLVPVSDFWEIRIYSSGIALFWIKYSGFWLSVCVVLWQRRACYILCDSSKSLVRLWHVQAGYNVIWIRFSACTHIISFWYLKTRIMPFAFYYMVFVSAISPLCIPYSDDAGYILYSIFWFLEAGYIILSDSGFWAICFFFDSSDRYFAISGI